MAHKETIADGVELWLGDCREVLPLLPKVDAVVTDPVWPNAPEHSIPGSDRPEALFAEVAPFLRTAKRVVVHLGCDSDPRMCVSLALPFRRTCWLEYACPTYKGRLLHTGDVAYCYGEWPYARPGATVIPGKCISAISDKEFIRGAPPAGKEKGGYEHLDHPMPRRYEFVRWLVRWWSAPVETILDPFMGSGTTGVAAVKLGRRFIGIEIEPRYFEIAKRRITEALRQPDLFIERPKPAVQEVLL
jgi:site-specific DNA-methyltransferase (adenine-specific)